MYKLSTHDQPRREILKLYGERLFARFLNSLASILVPPGTSSQTLQDASTLFFLPTKSRKEGVKKSANLGLLLPLLSVSVSAEAKR